MSRLLTLNWFARPSSIFAPSGALHLKYVYQRRHLAHGASIGEQKRIRPYKTSGKPRGMPPRKRVISSLDPQKLSELDFIDISGLHVATLWFGSIMTYIFFTHKRPSKNMKKMFPPGTRGFLYYHVPKNLPLSAGALRFRVCDSRETFEKGHDLSRGDGSIWQITTWMLMENSHQIFRERLVEEGLLSKETIKECRSILRKAGKSLAPRQPVIYATGQSFPIQIGRLGTSLFVVGQDRIVPLQIYNNFAPRTGKVASDDSLKGLVAHVCFEYEDRLLLRLLKLPPPYRGKLRIEEGQTTGVQYRPNFQSHFAETAIEILAKSERVSE